MLSHLSRNNESWGENIILLCVYVGRKKASASQSSLFREIGFINKMEKDIERANAEREPGSIMRRAHVPTIFRTLSSGAPANECPCSISSFALSLSFSLSPCGIRAYTPATHSVVVLLFPAVGFTLLSSRGRKKGEKSWEEEETERRRENGDKSEGRHAGKEKGTGKSVTAATTRVAVAAARLALRRRWQTSPMALDSPRFFTIHKVLCRQKSCKAPRSWYAASFSSTATTTAVASLFATTGELSNNYTPPAEWRWIASWSIRFF